MNLQYIKKPVFLKSLMALGVALQLSACGDLNDEASSSSSSSGSVTLGFATVSWVGPSQREDNVTDLTLGEIGGYRVYYGSEKGDYLREVDIKSTGATLDGSVTIGGLPTGRIYYFVVTTYDTEGRESLYSLEKSVVAI